MSDRTASQTDLHRPGPSATLSSTVELETYGGHHTQVEIEMDKESQYDEKHANSDYYDDEAVTVDRDDIDEEEDSQTETRDRDTALPGRSRDKDKDIDKHRQHRHRDATMPTPRRDDVDRSNVWGGNHEEDDEIDADGLSGQDTAIMLKHINTGLRLLQILVAIIATVLVANTDYSPEDSSGNKLFDIRFYQVPEFQFFVAIAALVFLYSVFTRNEVLIRCYYWCAPETEWQTSHEEGKRLDHLFQAARVMIEASLVLLTVIAAGVTASECLSDWGAFNVSACDGNDSVWAGVVAMLVLGLITAATTAVEWQVFKAFHRDEMEMMEEALRDAATTGGAADSTSTATTPRVPKTPRTPRAANFAMFKRSRSTRLDLATYDHPDTKTLGFFQSSTRTQKLMALLFRALQLIASIAGLVTVSMVDYANNSTSERTTQHTEIQFATAMWGLATGYCTLLLLFKAYRAQLQQQHDKNDVGSVEAVTRPLMFVADAAMVVLFTGAVAALVSRCRQYFAGTSETYCDADELTTMLIVFSAVCMFLFMASAIVTWTRWLKSRQRRYHSRLGRLKRQHTAISLWKRNYSDIEASQSRDAISPTPVDLSTIGPSMSIRDIPGVTDQANNMWFTQPTHDRNVALLYLCCLVACIIAGASVAIPKLDSDNGVVSFSMSFYQVSELQYLFGAVLIGVIASATMLVTHISSPFARHSSSLQALTDEAAVEYLQTGFARTLAPFEFTMHVCLMVVLVGAAIAGAIRCDTIVAGTAVKLCEDASGSAGVRVAIVSRKKKKKKKKKGVCSVTMLL
jgi:Casparian strip membrane protein domain